MVTFCTFFKLTHEAPKREVVITQNPEVTEQNHLPEASEHEALVEHEEQQEQEHEEEQEQEAEQDHEQGKEQYHEQEQEPPEPEQEPETEQEPEQQEIELGHEEQEHEPEQEHEHEQEQEQEQEREDQIDQDEDQQVLHHGLTDMDQEHVAGAVFVDDEVGEQISEEDLHPDPDACEADFDESCDPNEPQTVDELQEISDTTEVIPISDILSSTPSQPPSLFSPDSSFPVKSRKRSWHQDTGFSGFIFVENELT